MTVCTVSYFQSNFINVGLSRFKQTTGELHFVIKKKLIDRCAIDLLKSLFQLAKTYSSYFRQFLQARRLRHPANDNIFSLFDFGNVRGVYQKRALLDITVGTLIKNNDSTINMPCL